MISYHPTPPDAEKPWLYAKGFKIADTEDVERVARGVKSHVWSGIVWRGGDRKQSEFLWSDWCVMDFDDPDITLNQAKNAFCDLVHIIGTTKSHQKDKHGVVCDRFRVAVKWSERVKSLKTYRWNMQLLRDRYPLDRKALDGARYFFPCTEIVQMSTDGYTWDVNQNIPVGFEDLDPDDYAQDVKLKTKRHVITGRLPTWLDDFVHRGVILHGGRNHTCYRAAIGLLEHGYSVAEVEIKIASAPFDKSDFSRGEVSLATKNGLKRFLKDGGGI